MKGKKVNKIILLNVFWSLIISLMVGVLCGSVAAFIVGILYFQIGVYGSVILYETQLTQRMLIYFNNKKTKKNRVR